MTQARIEFNSSSLLESLLAAHRCCSTSIESLSALAGSFGVPGLSTLLQVQRHILLMLCTCFTLEGHAGRSDPPPWWPLSIMTQMLMAGRLPSMSTVGSALCAHCCTTRPHSGVIMSPVQARQALARALKAWVENEAWAPELMPAILASGGRPPAAEPPLIPAQVRLNKFSGSSALHLAAAAVCDVREAGQELAGSVPSSISQQYV